MRRRSCTVCGRVTEGTSRCPEHQRGGKRNRSCPICGVTTEANYCPEHDPETNEAIRYQRQPWRKAYTDPAYRKNRATRYEIARHRCETCGIPVSEGEWDCDHVVALRDGGTNDLANLRVSCKRCHVQKTTQSRRNRR